MRHLFVVDPVERLLPKADTSIAFLREAQRRGGELAVCGVESLGLDPSGRPFARTTAIAVNDGPDWYSLGETGRAFLDDYDVVWMRKDPPFDLGFLNATYLLSMVAPPTLVVNDPQALRDGNEKLLALRFPELCPETLVTRDLGELQEFRERLGGEMIVKPLGGAGGEGVFHITPGDKNARAILDASTRHGSEWTMAQRYIPEIRSGDKRIILVEGEPVGAVMRVPLETEARANFHAGGRAARTTLSAREVEICATVGPTLRDLGLVFVGIDVIGRFLTEINITSPTGIREIFDLDGVAIEPLVLDAVERRWRARRS